MDVISMVKQHKVIAIIRGVYGGDMLSLTHALYEGGIRLVEVTFDQKDPDCVQKTSREIATLNAQMSDKMLIGAGTVLNVAQTEAAIEAGAKYIISPNTRQSVIEQTKKRGAVSIPGAMTPSEIMDAVDYGADFVKLFPFGPLGMPYVKSILSPLSQVKLLAVGGVNENNVGEILRSGCFYGAGIGGYFTEKKVIQAGDFAEITKRAEHIVKDANNQ